jgi:exo-beta-1,3-glucanase (GH17 family)
MTTTYVCPAAGTYTIAPLTTTVESATVWVYPTPASYPAGTYTQSEVVTTVTVTDYVFTCPFATSTPTPVLASWAMTFTPYTDSGNCMSASQVASDIAQIAAKGFKSVRVYSTDCSSLQNIGSAAAANGLKLIVGVFITNTGTSGAQEQVDQITQWATSGKSNWDLVEMIVVGNEAILDNYVTAGQLAAFIQSSRSAFRSAGYSGPVTTTEPLDIWQSNSATLCPAVDIVGCNIHPFFNPAVLPASAGAFVASQLDIVDTLCPGKTGVNLETGWPHGGQCNGLACPGDSQQAEAVKSIMSAAGGRSAILSYSDDLWEAPGPFDCEQSWGSIQLFS